MILSRSSFIVLHFIFAVSALNTQAADFKWKQVVDNSHNSCVQSSISSNMSGASSDALLNCIRAEAATSATNTCVQFRLPSNCQETDESVLGGMQDPVVAQSFYACRDAVTSQCSSDVSMYISSKVASVENTLKQEDGPAEIQCDGAFGTGDCCTEGTAQINGAGKVEVCGSDGSFVEATSQDQCSNISAVSGANSQGALTAKCVTQTSASEGGGGGASGTNTAGTDDEPSVDGTGDSDSSSDSSSSSSSASSESAGSADSATCDAAYSEARNCCENPLSCLVGGSDSETSRNAQAGLMTLYQGGQMYAGQQDQAAAMNGESSTAMCDFMNTAGSVGAGLNMAAAAVCMQKKTKCNNICGSKRCNEFNSNIAASAMSGVSSAMASQIASQCASYTASSNGLNGQIEFMPDCSDPANSSNPNCNGECSGANAASNPFCNGGGGSGNSKATSSFATDTTSYGSSAAEYDSNPDLGEDVGNQAAFGGGMANKAQANAISGGGGGGLSGAPGGADLGDSSGGGSAGGGYNTAVLRGVSGGGGYTGGATTSRVAVSSTGGFSGYGSNSKGSGSGIDLKQFLPGAKNDPRKRTVAGVQRNTAAQIGPKETNIFQTMSVKYKQMCQLKRMWDCPALSKRGGN